MTSADGTNEPLLGLRARRDTAGMTRIRTRCPECGVVHMELSAITLSLDVGVYAFICPECQVEVTKVASQTTLMLLTAAGVAPADSNPFADADLEPPDEELAFEDWAPDPQAPAFTLNDLIDFHFRLREDTELHELLLQER